jgi:hypothetical protein
LACDIGVRKNPSVARGPKLIMETRQPHSTITTGVRHPIVEAFVTEGNETAMIGNPYRECENNRHTKKDATAAPRDPNALQVEALRIAVGRDFLDRDPGGCLYGLAPSSPNEKLRKTSSARAWQLIPLGLADGKRQYYA